MEKELENTGLSKNESKVYLTLLQLGSSAAGIIAEKSKVYRTNVYEALNRLIERGLVSYIYKGHQKLFQAEDPTKILDSLEEKKAAFAKVLPRLALNSKLNKNKEKVTIYEGLNGIKAILNDIIKEKEQDDSFDEVVAFGIPKDAAIRTKSFVNHYHKRRIALKLKQKHLYDENAKRRIAFLNRLPLTQAAYLPNAINSPATTTIYNCKVAFWIWSEPILSILIESRRMADAYRKYFDILFSYSQKDDPNEVLKN